MTPNNPQVGDIERLAQNRVVKFFQDVLGYDYLGNREYRENNSNIEADLVKAWLSEQKKYSDEVINKAILQLQKIATDQVKSLYDINKEVYGMLRYGIEIKEQVGRPSVHVHFIDWANPQKNSFAIAEEVTIVGPHDKRPDVAIYVNGIALWVLELKRSKVSISEGIRQNLDNQQKKFIRPFFATQQLIMAGNDTQGLQYGTIETPEKYYLTWKEDIGSEHQNILDRHIFQLLHKERLLDMIHKFVVFDAGIKKLARHNQYFAVKASQESLKKREGGIIRHTQGSGKSLTMVWLAKWIRENIDNSRVLIITDRVELDEQIEKVFVGVNEELYRTKSGKDLLEQLNQNHHSLIGSLVHKFGNNQGTEDQSYEDYIADIRKTLPKNFNPQWDLYVFVDECHRTQSWKLHKAMKEILPNAVFIWFTGTPLLKKDKATSKETFGKYIHTYKFDEAISDKVVLDLRYEARNIEQKIVSQDKIDIWFESKTQWLSDLAVKELKKKRWTMQKVLSSKERLERIVADVLFDFETKPRLQLGRGNAMLVAGSIYEACKYYELFVGAGFTKCAIVTSFKPNVAAIRNETTGEDELSENVKKYEVYNHMIASYFGIKTEEVKDQHIEDFEKDIKKKFVKDPGQMRLLIVVDKLLTGFDAPPATYLYIDKSMQDHWLFQAICRVNRLDENDQWDEFDKDYWYIIDYKDLFQSMGKAIKDYTEWAFEWYDDKDVSGLLKDRLEEAKKKLDETLEQVKALTEWVKAPKGINEYKDYFIAGEGELKDEKEQLRLEFYKKVSSLVRAYTNIANEMADAGYSKQESQQIKTDVEYFTDLRDELKLMSSDYLDLKRLNPAMRHLIDSYIQAEDSQKILAFENTSLLEIIIKEGIQAAIEKLPKKIGKEKDAVAETIENNIRKLVTDEQAVNPKYFEKMSTILDELVKKRKEKSIKYEQYLKEIAKLAEMVMGKEDPTSAYPAGIKGSMARKALYDNLWKDEELAIKLDETIRRVKQDNWRSSTVKARILEYAINQILDDEVLTKTIFGIVKEQNEY